MSRDCNASSSEPFIHSIALAYPERDNPDDSRDDDFTYQLCDVYPSRLFRLHLLIEGENRPRGRDPCHPEGGDKVLSGEWSLVSKHGLATEILKNLVEVPAHNTALQGDHEKKRSLPDQVTASRPKDYEEYNVFEEEEVSNAVLRQHFGEKRVSFLQSVQVEVVRLDYVQHHQQTEDYD